MTRGKQRNSTFWTRAATNVGPAALLAGASAMSLACDQGDEASESNLPVGNAGGETFGVGAGSGSGGGSGDDIVVNVGGTPDPAGSGGGLPEIMIVTSLPPGFVAADEHGGWSVVGPVETVDLSASADCANVLRVIARDFSAEHSDFQQDEVNGLYEGIVQDVIGDDRKPLLTSPTDEGDLVQSDLTFNEWYRNVVGVNLPFVVDLWLEPVGETFVFDSSSFFPLVDVGYALQDGGQGQTDGFHFTTELHTRFEYQGGETFTFRGDDDVWVYINGRLAIDIGGVHSAEEATVNIDAIAAEFQMVLGGVYTLDLFQAERRTSESNFRIETTLDFTECGEILPVDVPVR